GEPRAARCAGDPRSPRDGGRPASHVPRWRAPAWTPRGTPRRDRPRPGRRRTPLPRGSSWTTEPSWKRVRVGVQLVEAQRLRAEAELVWDAPQALAAEETR